MTMLQIVITIWLGAHPFTYTLPRIYPLMAHDACEQQLGQLLRQRRHKHQHIELECVPTDKRDI